MARNPIVDRVYDIVIAILFVTIKIRSSPAMS
jgi:hypothetical protein